MPNLEAMLKGEPGIYPGTTYADYDRVQALNFSVLKQFNKSPAHVRAAIDRPSKHTKALDFGEAAHTAILEPDEFPRIYVKGVPGDRRTKKVKEAEKQLLLDHPDSTILTPTDYAKCAAMRDAAWRHRSARKILDGKGLNEVVIIWRDKPTGILCKARIDRLTTVDSWPVVADLKTSTDADEWSFQRSVAKYGYHQQGAWYLEGADNLAKVGRRHMIIAMEKEYPYALKVWELDGDAIQEGRALNRAFIETFAECQRVNSWPGYSDGIDLLTLPNWAFKTDLSDPFEGEHDGEANS